TLARGAILARFLCAGIARITVKLRERLVEDRLVDGLVVRGLQLGAGGLGRADRVDRDLGQPCVSCGCGFSNSAMGLAFERTTTLPLARATATVGSISDRPFRPLI